MAMNSPSGPIEATRNASMISAAMMARDREKARDSLDEREQDQLLQEQLNHELHQQAKSSRSFFSRLLDRLLFR